MVGSSADVRTVIMTSSVNKSSKMSKSVPPRPKMPEHCRLVAILRGLSNHLRRAFGALSHESLSTLPLS